MKYLGRSFSISMPGAHVRWPFKYDPMAHVGTGERCSTCGAPTTYGTTHEDARDAGRPRRRICFGTATR